MRKRKDSIETVYMYTISQINSHEKEKGQYRIKFICIQFHG